MKRRFKSFNQKASQEKPAFTFVTDQLQERLPESALVEVQVEVQEEEEEVLEQEEEKVEVVLEESFEVVRPEVNRECGDCNICCHGWLYAEVFDQILTYGSPCHYVSCNGCTVYEQRPENPCRTYKCAWLKDGLLPEWFKPNKSKLICTWRRWKNGDDLDYYIDVIECGDTMGAKHLQWLLDLSENQGINLRYSVEGKCRCKGSDAFVKWYNEDFEWL